MARRRESALQAMASQVRVEMVKAQATSRRERPAAAQARTAVLRLTGRDATGEAAGGAA